MSHYVFIRRQQQNKILNYQNNGFSSDQLINYLILIASRGFMGRIKNGGVTNELYSDNVPARLTFDPAVQVAS